MLGLTWEEIEHKVNIGEWGLLGPQIRNLRFWRDKMKDHPCYYPAGTKSSRELKHCLNMKQNNECDTCQKTNRLQKFYIDRNNNHWLPKLNKCPYQCSYKKNRESYHCPSKSKTCAYTRGYPIELIYDAAMKKYGNMKVKFIKYACGGFLFQNNKARIFVSVCFEPEEFDQFWEFCFSIYHQYTIKELVPNEINSFSGYCLYNARKVITVKDREHLQNSL